MLRVAAFAELTPLDAQLEDFLSSEQAAESAVQIRDRIRELILTDVNLADLEERWLRTVPAIIYLVSIIESLEHLVLSKRLITKKSIEKTIAEAQTTARKILAKAKSKNN